MNVTYGHVGDRINEPRQMDELPVGSVIHERANPAHFFTKERDERWRRATDRATFSPQQFGMGGQMVVQSIPDGWVSRPRPQETVEAHMWKFRENALYSAYNHSVNYEASDAAIAEMGAGFDQFTLGHGVEVRSPVTLERTLPDGTIVYTGNPVEPNARFGVFIKERGRWKPVMGEAGSIGDRAVIHTYGGSTEKPEWLSREGTEADAEAIVQFRAKAWRVGWRLKQAQGWCSTYEAVMRDLGLTSAATRAVTHQGVRVGDTVRTDGAHALPNGSILRWQSRDDDTQWALFVRTMQSDNQAGTLRVGGVGGASERNYRSSMRVVYIPVPDEPIAWPVENALSVWEGLMPGTMFGIDETITRYIKAGDGRVAQIASEQHARTEPLNPTGRWNLRDFGNRPNMYITGFRGVQ
jgi:hypothetical protein